MELKTSLASSKGVSTTDLFCKVVWVLFSLTLSCLRYSPASSKDQQTSNCTRLVKHWSCKSVNSSLLDWQSCSRIKILVWRFTLFISSNRCLMYNGFFRWKSRDKNKTPVCALIWKSSAIASLLSFGIELMLSTNLYELCFSCFIAGF